MGEVLQTKAIVPLSAIEFLDASQTDADFYHFMLAEYLGQGGDYLFFQVTGNEDPPVYAWYEDELIKIAERFSEFLYIHFWDCHRYNLHKHQVSIMHHPAIDALQVPPRYFIPI